MQKTKKAYRKKTSDATEEAEEPQSMLQQQKEKDDAEVVRLRLLRTKELQKLRERSKGVNAGVAAELNAPPSSHAYHNIV